MLFLYSKYDSEKNTIVKFLAILSLRAWRAESMLLLGALANIGAAD